ncbi:MAG: hypothetical protein IPO02_01435 [Bacteroidetes bacterium]|nr:hypothetical protein [Bacteroidota bacterium]
MAVAGLLTAYTFQVITDAWGDAPYKEALKALDVDGGIVSPLMMLNQLFMMAS